MKTGILAFFLVVLLQACSAPRYTYFFDHQQYSLGKGQNVKFDPGPVAPDPHLLFASIGQPEITLPESHTAAEPPAPEMSQELVKPVKRQALHSRTEEKLTPQKAARTEKANVAPSPANGKMDKDLKMAAIFGGAGLLGLLIGGPTLNVLGGIALLVGLVFFVRWMIRR